MPPSFLSGRSLRLGSKLVSALLALAVSARAQSVVLSSLGQPANWASTLGESSGHQWGHAWDFVTGAGTYELRAVTFVTANNATAATGFAVSLYSGFSTSGPTGLVTTFTGSISPPDGTNTYPTVPTTLLSNTHYWLVFSAFASPTENTIQLVSTVSGAQDAGAAAGWSLGNTRYTTHTGGASWSLQAGDIQPLYALTASVPEPAAYAAFAGIAALGAALLRRRAKTVVA